MWYVVALINQFDLRLYRFPGLMTQFLAANNQYWNNIADPWDNAIYKLTTEYTRLNSDIGGIQLNIKFIFKLCKFGLYEQQTTTNGIL